MNPVKVHIHINRNNLGFEVNYLQIESMNSTPIASSTHLNISPHFTLFLFQFQDIEDVDPAQTITLTAADLKEGSNPIDLYYVKFQRVKSLTFYIEENEGGDITAIGGLRIMGKTVATTNMKDFKKQG